VDIRISLVNADRAGGLESLSNWLRGEPELAGLVSVTAAEPNAHELGTLVDALVVAVGSGGALSVLAMSLNTWLSQPRRSEVRIRVQGETGRIVEISADRISGERVEALVRQALDRAASEE
jgi:Effector Associated Constant Component 1